MTFDTIERRLDRRWVPTAQSYERARKDILTVIGHLAGEQPGIQSAMREYWLESTACSTAYGIALEVFHVLDDLGYDRATRLYKALKLHAEVNKALGPEELFKFASPEKAAALIHSKNREDYARTYATLEFGRDLSGTIDAETARDVLQRFEVLWFVYPDRSYHIHLIREGIWLDLHVPSKVIEEQRRNPVFALQIQKAERDASGFSS